MRFLIEISESLLFLDSVDGLLFFGIREFADSIPDVLSLGDISIVINGEESLSLELEGGEFSASEKILVHLGSLFDNQAVLVIGSEPVFESGWVWIIEEDIVLSNLTINTVLLGDPVHERLGLGSEIKVSLTENFSDFSGAVLLNLTNLEETGVLESGDLTWGESEEVWVGEILNILSLNIDLVCEVDGVSWTILILGEIRSLNRLDEVVSKVGDVDENWVDDGEGSLGLIVKFLSDDELEIAEADNIFVTASGDGADIAKFVDSVCWVTSSSHSVEGQESWIIPPLDEILLNKFSEFSLGDDVVGDVQS